MRAPPVWDRRNRARLVSCCGGYWTKRQRKSRDDYRGFSVLGRAMDLKPGWVGSENPSGGLFGRKCAYSCGRRLTWRNDFHLLPVVRKFLSAIQANDVSSSGPSGLATRPRANCNRKTVSTMPATEERIHHLGKHVTYPSPNDSILAQPW